MYVLEVSTCPYLVYHDIAMQQGTKSLSYNLISLCENKNAELAITKKTLTCHQTPFFAEGEVWGRDYCPCDNMENLVTFAVLIPNNSMLLCYLGIKFY